MKRSFHINPLCIGTLFLISQSVATVAAQAYPDSEPVAEASATGFMGYVALVAVVVSLSVSYSFGVRVKRATASCKLAAKTVTKIITAIAAVML